METLLVSRDSHGVVTVTFNRPEKKNAINTTMWRELVEVFDEVEASRDDRVLVLTGAGDAFTSGADLTPASGDENPTRGFGAAVHSMRVVGRTVMRLHELHVPTIAAVNGVTTGAGCNLALGCDLIIAADTARFSEIFARRGLSLDGGGSWILPRLIGPARALDLLLSQLDGSLEGVTIQTRKHPSIELLVGKFHFLDRLGVFSDLALTFFDHRRADFIVFVTSERAAMVNGAVLRVDGGAAKVVF